MEYADGWYWHIEDGEEPEIVQVTGDRAWQAGSDVGVGLPGHATEDGWPPILGGRLVGPLTPPEE
jgi:hypothetical protein